MAQVVDTAGKQTVVTPSVTRSHGGGNAGYNPGEDNEVEPSFEGDESSLGKFVATIPRLVQGRQAPRQSAVPASIGSVQLPHQMQVTSTPAPGTASYGGFDRVVEPISVDEVGQAVKDSVFVPSFTHDSGLDAWEQMSAESEGRDPRSSNMFGEEYDMGGSPLGWADNTLDYVGNTPTNDAYLRYFVDSGLMSEDDAWALMHKPQSIAEEYEMFGNDPRMSPREREMSMPTRRVSDELFDGTVEMLDDRSPNYWKLTSDDMTGTQYIKYRDELGMGGRQDIDPARTYSKKEEARDHGFIPFLPDSSAYANMTAHDMFDIPGDIGHAVGNARTQYLTPDYQMSYETPDGTRKTVGGNEFDTKAPAFMNGFYYDRQYNPEKFVTKPEDGAPYTAMINQFMVPDVDGNETYHYGHLVDVSYVDDDTYQFAFSDGSVVNTSKDYFDSVYDGDSIDIGKPDVVPVSAASGIVDIDRMGPTRYQARINEYVVPDENGNDTYHYSSSDQNVRIDNGPNGTYTFSFEDGTSVNAPASFFEQIYDPDTNMVMIPHDRVFIDDVRGDLDVNYDTAAPDMRTADVRYMPALMLDDGSVMTLEDVERLLNDKSPEDDPDIVDPETGDVIISDDDISYQFSGLGGGGLRDLDLLGPRADMFLDSIAPFVPQANPFIDIVQAASDYGPKALDLGLSAAGHLPLLNQITNRPARLGGQEMFSGDGVDFSNLMNNVADWTLGSLSISSGTYLPWLYSASNANRALNGVNPNSYDPLTKSYGLMAGGWDDEGNLRYGVYDTMPDGTKARNDAKSDDVRFSNAAGNFLVPFTEMIVGPVGEQIVPLEKLASLLDNRRPVGSAVKRLLRDELIGMGAEGVEEILGNYFEDATAYGRDAYADPVLDESTGKPVTDMYGHETRNSSTPMWKRMDNFLGDFEGNANAFTGGALVDLAMRAPQLLWWPNGDAWNAVMADRARLKTGAPLYIAPEEVGEWRDLGEDYASLYDTEKIMNDTAGVEKYEREPSWPRSKSAQAERLPV